MFHLNGTMRIGILMVGKRIHLRKVFICAAYVQCTQLELCRNLQFLFMNHHQNRYLSDMKLAGNFGNLTEGLLVGDPGGDDEPGLPVDLGFLFCKFLVMSIQA